MIGLRLLPLVLGAGTLLLVTPVVASSAVSMPRGTASPTVGPGQVRATALLDNASAASRQRTYRGTQYASAWRPGFSAASVADIRHTPAQGSVVTVRPTSDRRSAEQAVTATPDLDVRLVRLLAEHYQLDVAPAQTSAGRPADVIDVRRTDGTMAGRFWIDRASSLLLRREVFDDKERLVRSSALVDLAVDSPRPGVAAQDAVATQGRLTEAELAALREQGYRIPTSLPGQLELFDARVRTHESKQVLHLSYSDGLSSLSLFAQPGHLGNEPRDGFDEHKVDSASVWVAESSPQRVVWSGEGYVFTLLSDAPVEAVTAVVTALPHDPPQSTGFLARIGRGLARLGSWLNPFD
ncbi:MAG: sigma-E factor regulatory protein RseB domain-containing protein [Mycobacteriales bacterium]